MFWYKGGTESTWVLMLPETVLSGSTTSSPRGPRQGSTLNWSPIEFLSPTATVQVLSSYMASDCYIAQHQSLERFPHHKVLLDSTIGGSMSNCFMPFFQCIPHVPQIEHFQNRPYFLPAFLSLSQALSSTSPGTCIRSVRASSEFSSLLPYHPSPVRSVSAASSISLHLSSL